MSRSSSHMRHLPIFVIGLIVGSLGALGVRPSHALRPFPTHTTTRYSLERVDVKDVMTGEPAPPDEANKWRETGILAYTVNNKFVSPGVARASLSLEREAP